MGLKSPIVSNQWDEVRMGRPFKLSIGTTSLCSKLDGERAVITQQTCPDVHKAIRDEIKAIHGDEGAVQSTENGSRLAHITPNES